VSLKDLVRKSDWGGECANPESIRVSSEVRQPPLEYLTSPAGGPTNYKSSLGNWKIVLGHTRKLRFVVVVKGTVVLSDLPFELIIQVVVRIVAHNCAIYKTVV